MLEPTSNYYDSHRLRLHFWDWGQDGKPTLILIHGGLDHGRNWDWVARELRQHFHVYAMDLRGHGNSQWVPGALYSIIEHILDLSAFADIINVFPTYLIGHSLGGIVASMYSGVYPDRVKKVISIEGLGPPLRDPIHRPAPEKIRNWIETIRAREQRGQRSYPSLDCAVKRMKEVNPHLSEEMARHLTIYGTKENADGSLVWRFDNYARPFAPCDLNLHDLDEVFGQIACPVLLFWGEESWAPDPETDLRAAMIPNHRICKVENAGHWVHQDQLEVFLAETVRFLSEPDE